MLIYFAKSEDSCSGKLRDIIKLALSLFVLIPCRLLHLLNKCWFENWIYKGFFLDIYRSQTDYGKHFMDIEGHKKEKYEIVV